MADEDVCHAQFKLILRAVRNPFLTEEECWQERIPASAGKRRAIRNLMCCRFSVTGGIFVGYGDPTTWESVNDSQAN